MSSSEDDGDYECKEFEIGKSYTLNDSVFVNSKKAYNLVSDKTVQTKLKKFQLVASILKNDTESFKQLLTPTLYKITDNQGNDLLQMAIIKNRGEIFEYILTLPDYPLNHCNKQKKNAVAVALTAFVDNDLNNPEIEEHYAIQLIKKGAQIPKLALHQAASRYFVEVTRLLLEKGIGPSVNSLYGTTPLHSALDSFRMGHELEALLLAYGVDPLTEDIGGYTSFELAMNRHRDSNFLEHLTLYTIDENTTLKLHIPVLLKLAIHQSSSFDTVTEHLKEVVVDELAFLDFYRFFFIQGKFLERLLDRCAFIPICVILASNKFEKFIPFTIGTNVKFENLHTFVQETFDCDIVDFVMSLRSNSLFAALTKMELNEADFVRYIYYFLSYGLKFNEIDLQIIYEMYGYCTPFKILLQFDFDLGISDLVAFSTSVTPFTKYILPMFIYNVNLDLRTYLEYPRQYSVKNVYELLDFYADRGLASLCMSNWDYDESVKLRIDRMPEIPTLLQLARDTFRKHLVEELGLNTSKLFYTYLNSLPINDVYKKIINLERKIYL